MEYSLHPFNTFDAYFGVDIVASYKGQWIFCRHHKRDTWENPGGHIEAGETPLDAAKRELYEETGALDFAIEPLCDYTVDGESNGRHYQGNVQVYFAAVHTLGALPPGSEMAAIAFFDALPGNLTYPMPRDFFALAQAKKPGNL